MNIIACQEFDTRRPCVKLDGNWQFACDTSDKGMSGHWFREGHGLPERIAVPGCAEARPYRVRERKAIRDFADPELKRGSKLRHPVRHPTWYKRTFKIPASWHGENIRLHIGGVKPSADFWINGVHLGRTLSSRTPVCCDLTPHVRLGKVNELTVRIDRERGCFDGMYDRFANWSGLYRSVWIEALSPIHLRGIHVILKIQPAAANVHVKISCVDHQSLADLRLRVTVRAVRGHGMYRAETPIGKRNKDGCVRVKISMPGGRLWSPESPNLYLAEVALLADGKVVDQGAVQFGLREVSVKGLQVLLNGKPVFLRGGCDDQFYPETVCPPADKAFYLRRLRLMRKWGFNYTKSAIEIFPKEHLDAADEVGVLVCQAMPFGTKNLIEKSPASVPVAAVVRDELRNIITADRNHPCVIIYSMLSETNTTKYKPWFRFCSQELPALTRKLNPTALVVDATGMSSSPLPGYESVPLSTRWGERNTDLEGYWLRWCRTCRPLAGPIPGLDPVTKPFIFHEFAWIAALSEPSLVKRYAGMPCKPLYIPEMVAAARANGQVKILPAMVAASRKLKHALRKQALELARKEPKAAGYHHWLIQDFPNCAEGVFNDFWEEPHDLSAVEFRQSNDDTVLLLEHGRHWNFRWGAQLPLAVTVSHFAPERMTAGRLCWSVNAGTRRLAGGELPVRNLTPGALKKFKLPEIILPQSDRPSRLTVLAELRTKNHAVASNRWFLWAFPECRLVPPDGGEVIITDRLTHDDRISHMEAGARVLFLCPNPLHPPGGDLPRTPCNPVDRTVPYNTGNTMLYRNVPYNTGTIGNTGTLINPHPALGDFPHEGWCDFAWAPMIDGALPFALDGYGMRINPIIRSIGHIRTMQDKAYMFELAVGRGRLLAAGLNMNGEPGDDPAADYLRYCLIRYLAGRLTRNPARISGKCLRARIKQYESRPAGTVNEIKAGLM